MPLILRAVKGSKLTISEMDGNLTYLASTLSGSIIQVTGSSIDASNTEITASNILTTNITSTDIVANTITGSFTGSLVGELTGTASWALDSVRAITASYARTASYSTTLGADLYNASESGNLRLLSSANTTITQIDEFYSYAALGVVTSSIGITASAGWEGKTYAVKDGSNYYIYVYIGGQWRSSSLA